MMTADTFIQNFDLLAEAPGGIPKLRELILQLAVRGKLVPQDSRDEPAEALLDLLRRVAAKQGVKPPRNPKSKPAFPIPDSWVWVHMPDVGRIVGGGTPRSSNASYYTDEGIPWLTPADLYGFRDKYIRRGKRDITEEGLKKSSAQLMPKGTVLFSSRAPIGYVAIAANPLATNQGFKSCVPYEPTMSEFIYYYLMGAGAEIDRNASGTTFREISGKGMSKVVFPLPPLPEQKRIVAKVDELMKRCDELEARQTERNESRTALTASCLHAVTSAPRKTAAPASPEPSRRAIDRALQSFPLIIDTPESVAELRKTILQLAVQGLLVPQDPNDEPASKLLSKIVIGKQQLVADGKIKKPKPLPPIDPEQVPYALPQGWLWARLGNLTTTVEYGTSHKATEISSGIPVLRMNNIQGGIVVLQHLKYVPETIDELPRLFLKSGDILFNRTNSHELVGKTGIFKGPDATFTFASYLIRLAVPGRYVSPDYVNHWMNSGHFRRTQIEPELTQQCGQANFSGGKLKGTVVPLPPLAEQKRVVAKVNELMALCDALDGKLTQSREDADALAAAVVHHLCNGGMRHTEGATA